MKSKQNSLESLCERLESRKSTSTSNGDPGAPAHIFPILGWVPSFETHVLLGVYVLVKNNGQGAMRSQQLLN